MPVQDALVPMHMGTSRIPQVARRSNGAHLRSVGCLWDLGEGAAAYRGSSRIRNTPLLGPYGRDYLGSYGGPRGGGCFL